MEILAISNPFYSAYVGADLLGKGIFILLYAISVLTWVLILYKGWMTHHARRESGRFHRYFAENRARPLDVDLENRGGGRGPNPFYRLYANLRKYTVEILNKNRRFGGSDGGTSYLSPTDIDVVENHLATTVAHETKELEKNLYILSTVVSLAPFLGLLGTVWGILIFFSEMQTAQMAHSSQAIIGGLSLALATTVLGLLNAIPALIGYNYLKNSVSDFAIEMEGFSYEMLATVEMQYRKVDLGS